MHTHADTHTYRHTDTDTHTYMHTHTHTQTHTQTHVPTGTHTQTQTQTHIPTCTHTQTHTQTHVLDVPRRLGLDAEPRCGGRKQLPPCTVWVLCVCVWGYIVESSLICKCGSSMV